jgi:hypothetical protein
MTGRCSTTARRFAGGLFAAAALGAAAAAHGATCDGAAHRAFDFWLGSWEVFLPDGKQAGSNVIASEYNGCVVHERYSTPTGFAGESLNAYDVARKVWHQTWMDSTGTVLLLEGGLKGDAMVLEGRTLRKDGLPLQHRITWTPVSDGSVRQHWETRSGEAPWTTAFDGRYRRMKS